MALPSLPRPVHVLTSDHDVAATESAAGALGNNRPEARKRMILEALRGTPARIEYVAGTLQATPDNVCGAHDDTMLYLFREEAWRDWEALKCVDLEDEWTVEGRPLSAPLRGPDGTAAAPATEAAAPATGESMLIPAQHAPHDGIHRPGNTLFSRLSYHAQDRFTPIGRGTAATISHDIAVAHAAASRAVDGSTSVVYALCSFPGHHSTRDTYGGYCYVNQSAVVAGALRRTLSKVAVVDVDYHCGNGTMAVFWDDPTVFVASLHMDPDADYPFTVGFADQRGGPGALGATMCVPLPPKCDWAAYKPALEAVLDGVRGFGAEALVVSMGLDTVAGDPEITPGAGMLLELEAYASMGAMFRDAGIPLVFVQEGGYYLERIPDAVAAVLGLSSASD